MSWTAAREVARHVLSSLPNLREPRFQFLRMSLRKYLLEKVDETGNLHMELIPPEPQVCLRNHIDGETVQLDFMLNTNS